jgi:magnesium and cobalt transporter
MIILFNSYFLTEFSDDVETIGGYLVNKFERVPLKGEIIVISNLLFKILSADSRTIKRIKLSKKNID